MLPAVMSRVPSYNLDLLQEHEGYNTIGQNYATVCDFIRIYL